MANLLQELLIRSAELYPQKTAIKHKDKAISYKNLQLLSSQLCSCLLRKGVKVGDRAGIYIDKSIDAVIAIFGVLKSGACYVPLDPTAPPQRQAQIINDCSLEYLITSSKKIFLIRQILQKETSLKHVFIVDISKEEHIQVITGVNLIFKGEIYRSSISGSNHNAISEDNLAYILYTSGSTGQPKGVMITHKASLAFVNWAYSTFNVNVNDIVSSHAPFCFDLSIFDIFVTVKAAATICIVPPGLSAFPKSLGDFIENEKISIWYSVPSVLTQLVLYGNLKERDFSDLRAILFAGEVFPTKYLRKLMRAVPQAAYYNLYGPTETNVITYYPLKSPPAGDGPIPIGKPCNGVEIFIVDDSGRLAKKGQIGQLHVSSPTVMAGYWNDTKKTKDALFKNHFLQDATKKIYKTGDLVRRDNDGNLEYHGRCDDMIKKGGYRIEPAEIESTLLKHRGIKEAAVIGIQNEIIGNEIKAVIVLKEGRIVSDKEIKLFCCKNLPNYMVPDEIAFSEYIPRVATGKIDRRRLVV